MRALPHVLRSASYALTSFSFETDVDMRIGVDTLVATWDWIVCAFSSFPFQTGLDVHTAFKVLDRVMVSLDLKREALEKR